MSALKLEEFDIALKTLVRYGVCLCAEDKLRNRGKVGFVGIKSRIGLALVYLNQHAYGAHAKEVSVELKRNSLRKALKELAAAVELTPASPQLLVLLANFVGFICGDWIMIKKLAGTTAHTQW